MNLIIDLILAVIILIFAIIAYKKGFLASLFDFLGTIIAWIVSINLSEFISAWVYQTFIKVPITDYVYLKLTESANTATESLVASIPEFITTAATTFGIDINNIISSNSGKEIETAVSSITSGIIEPIITILIRIVVVILLYIVLIFIIKSLSKLFKNVNKIPIVGSLNKFLGIIVGLLKGSIIALLICIVFNTILCFAGGELFNITQETLKSTYIFNFLNQFNPLV